jgi:putative PEP-CTERM system TPR-repeat lipoprotein
MRRISPAAAPQLLRAIPVALALSMAGLPAALPAMAASPMERAQEARARGNLREAQIELRNLVRDKPEDAGAHAALAAISLELGDTELAEREARAALDRGYDPGTGTALLMRSYLASNRAEALLRDFPQVEAPQPVAAQVAAARTQALLLLGRKEDAVKAAAEARRLGADVPEVGIAAANVALVQGDRAAAEAAIDAVLAKHPDNADALLRKGGLQFERRDLPAALASFDRLIQRVPNSLAGRLRRAETLLQMQDDARARADVDAVLAVMPANAPATYMRALLRLRTKDWAGADADLQRLGPALGNFPNGFLLQATAKQGLGQKAQAEDAAGRHVARNPDDPRGVRLLAALALEDKRPRDAAAVLSTLAERGKADVESLELLGTVQSLLNRPREAATAFQKASELAPKDAGILNRLAAARLAMGDAEGTEEAANRALALGSETPATRQMLAFAALAQGDTAAAEAEMNRIGPEARKGETGGVLDGTLLTMRMDLPAARAAFEGALRQNPNSNPARLGLARLAFLEDKPEEAERLLGDVLKQEPGHLEAAAQLTNAASGNGPRAAAARAMLEQVQAAHPAEPLLAMALSTVLLNAKEPGRAVAVLNTEPLQGKGGVAMALARSRAHAAAGEWKQAEEASRLALAEAPASAAARRQLAGLLVRNGDPKGAEALIRLGLREAPGDATLQQTLIGLLREAQGPEAAMEAARQLAARPDARPASLVLPGDLLLAGKQPQKAAEAYAAAAKEAPSATLVLREATAWRAAGQQDKAAAAVQAWLARTPEDTGALLLLSQLDMQAGRMDKAEQNLTKLVSLKPRDVVALNNLAWLTGQRGGKEALSKAEGLAERAYYLSPNQETADTLGWILARNGQAARAVPLLRRAAALRGTAQPDPAAAYRLAYALNATGARDEALAVLTPALAGEQSFPERAEASRLLASLRGR